jgi:curved DNA-binding protein CbpA
MRSEELVILDENLLHSPFGSTHPYQFYRLLSVEIDASLPQIEAAYKKLSLLYHPDSHDTDKDAWTAQFQILSTIKSTLTNIEERQKYNRQSRRAAQSASVDVPQRLHRMGSGTTCRNAKQCLHLRQRGHAAEPLMSVIRQMQTRLHHTEPAATRRRRL